MDKDKKQELELKPADSSLQDSLPPGYIHESLFTIRDLSCSVHVCFVDLATVVSGFNLHSYSKSDMLIKYSEARFSPVSSEPANCIRLATPSYYHDLAPEKNSELIADNLEGRYIEILNWRNRGSVGMETLKKSLTVSLPDLRNNVKAKITWACEGFWMYCASVDPNISYKRKKQMEYLSPGYNFMTKIEKPTEFAKQLGCDVGKQVLNSDLKSYYSAWHILASFLRRQSKVMGKYFIAVNHGPVIYLDDDKIERLLNDYSEEHSGSIVPFVKRKKYQEQQEYRFVVSVQFHSPNEDTFYLKVSDELRSLMAPIGSI